jgi:hypothetical protein
VVTLDKKVSPSEARWRISVQTSMRCCVATGHVHDSKKTRVKTAHVHPATCNLANCLNRYGSPIIYRCFAATQLLYRWRNQSGIFIYIYIYLYIGEFI